MLIFLVIYFTISIVYYSFPSIWGYNLLFFFFFQVLKIEGQINPCQFYLLIYALPTINFHLRAGQLNLASFAKSIFIICLSSKAYSNFHCDFIFLLWVIWLHVSCSTKAVLIRLYERRILCEQEKLYIWLNHSMWELSSRGQEQPGIGSSSVTDCQRSPKMK